MSFSDWTDRIVTNTIFRLQCFTHRHLGWKINVLDACDKEQPGAAEPSASTSEDLQSRGSVQYATRVKPDTENKRFYADNEPAKNGGSLRDNRYSKERNDMPSVPVELEENLRKDFQKSPAAQSEQQQQQFATPRYNDDSLLGSAATATATTAAVAATQQKHTLYAYPTSNYTYGNVPFYMPKVHYGSAQPVKPLSAYNYAPPPSSYNAHNNNNYRPIRQPAIGQYFRAQPNIEPDYRPAHTTGFVPKQHVAVKHGYRITGKRLPPNGQKTATRHSVVYKKPVYKYNVPPANYNAAAVPPTVFIQPVPSVYPAGRFQQSLVQPNQQLYQQQQQQQRLPSASVSQSVSVTYSSSVRQKSRQTDDGDHAPIENRQESVGQYHQFQGGFNPNTVVVEGGFKPIVPGGGSFQDRSDNENGMAGADDLDGTTPVGHREMKMSKKLISKKPAAKPADGLTGKPQEPRDTVTDSENRTGHTADSKQTAETVVF